MSPDVVVFFCEQLKFIFGGRRAPDNAIWVNIVHVALLVASDAPCNIEHRSETHYEGKRVVESILVDSKVCYTHKTRVHQTYDVNWPSQPCFFLVETAPIIDIEFLEFFRLRITTES